MLGRNSPQNIIDSFRKRQQLMPLIITILAFLLVIIGVVIIVLWVSGGGFSLSFLKRGPTPTSTLPPTPVLSPTPTLIPSETPTPESTITPTPSGPFDYEVQEFDSCWAIAEKFNADFLTLLKINNFPDGTCPIYAGQIILVPAPGQSMPTPTAVPPDLPSGTKITYEVQPGDSLQSIASEFNSTIEDILRLNEDKFEDPNNIPIGVELIIRVNLVTPTPTFAPTSTLAS
ncbi:MAG TPA: LysM peptidoglycan-binding domain-containing protein [Anaerolineae bacterium]|nr:LysM peptidoglycan-binding domain-containing protein [Anaerolineae bacterium]